MQKLKAKFNGIGMRKIKKKTQTADHFSKRQPESVHSVVKAVAEGDLRTLTSILVSKPPLNKKDIESKIIFRDEIKSQLLINAIEYYLSERTESRLNIISLILQLAPNLSFRGKSQKTALELATIYNLPEIFSLIVEANKSHSVYIGQDILHLAVNYQADKVLNLLLKNNQNLGQPNNNILYYANINKNVVHYQENSTLNLESLYQLLDTSSQEIATVLLKKSKINEIRKIFFAEIKQALISQQLPESKSSEWTHLYSGYLALRQKVEECRNKINSKNPEFKVYKTQNLIEILTEEKICLEELALLKNYQDIKLRLKKYLSSEEIYQSYFNNGIAKNLWPDCNTLLIYAKEKNIDIYIWKKQSENQLKIHGKCTVKKPQNIIHLLYTGCFTHFILLSHSSPMPDKVESCLYSSVMGEKTVSFSEETLLQYSEDFFRILGVTPETFFQTILESTNSVKTRTELTNEIIGALKITEFFALAPEECKKNYLSYTQKRQELDRFFITKIEKNIALTEPYYEKDSKEKIKFRNANLKLYMKLKKSIMDSITFSQLQKILSDSPLTPSDHNCIVKLWQDYREDKNKLEQDCLKKSIVCTYLQFLLKQVINKFDYSKKNSLIKIPNSTILCFAKIQKLTIYIWRKNTDTQLDLEAFHEESTSESTIHLLSLPNYFSLLNGINVTDSSVPLTKSKKKKKILVANLQDKLIYFEEIPFLKDGNCAFRVLGTNRQKVAAIFTSYADNQQVRESFAVEIKEFIISEKQPAAVLATSEIAETVKKFNTSLNELDEAQRAVVARNTHLEKMTLGQRIHLLPREHPDRKLLEGAEKKYLLSETMLNELLSRKEIFLSYINKCIRPEPHTIGSVWLHINGILLFAKHQKINIYIWRALENTNQLILVNYHQEEKSIETETIHMFFKNYNHFNLLLETELQPYQSASLLLPSQQLESEHKFTPQEIKPIIRDNLIIEFKKQMTIQNNNQIFDFFSLPPETIRRELLALHKRNSIFYHILIPEIKAALLNDQLLIANPQKDILLIKYRQKKEVIDRLLMNCSKIYPFLRGLDLRQCLQCLPSLPELKESQKTGHLLKLKRILNEQASDFLQADYELEEFCLTEEVCNSYIKKNLYDEVVLSKTLIFLLAKCKKLNICIWKLNPDQSISLTDWQETNPDAFYIDLLVEQNPNPVSASTKQFIILKENKIFFPRAAPVFFGKTMELSAEFKNESVQFQKELDHLPNQTILYLLETGILLTKFPPHQDSKEKFVPPMNERDILKLAQTHKKVNIYLWRSFTDNVIKLLACYEDKSITTSVHLLQGYDKLFYPLSQPRSLNRITLNEFNSPPIIQGVDIDAPSSYGLSPLQVAVLCGNIKTFHLLLEMEANIDFQNAEGNTALHLAALNADKTFTLLLLQEQADYQIRNYRGQTAFEITDDESIKTIIRNFIHQTNSNKFTQYLISEMGLVHSIFERRSRSLNLIAQYHETPILEGEDVNQWCIAD